MRNRLLLNSIGILSSAIDALNRAGKKEAIDKVTEKLLKLVEKLE